MKTCADFRSLGVRCCGSCHEDADELGYDMCQRETAAGEFVEVCCVVVFAPGFAEAIEAMGEPA